ncbi:hypothetical protein Tco_0231865 [Tanacetum coccineum]
MYRWSRCWFRYADIFTKGLPTALFDEFHDSLSLRPLSSLYKLIISSRVPVPLPEDPCEAVRQAHLVETDTESEPFEDPSETEILESPYVVASPTPLPDSTLPTFHDEELRASDISGTRSTSSDSTTPLSPDHPLTHTTPTLLPSLRRTARMVVRVHPTMSSGLLTRVAEAMTLSDSAFRKSEGDEMRDEDDVEEEDKSSDSDDEREGSEDEDPGLVREKDEAALEGQYQAVPAADTAVDKPLGLGYETLRRRELSEREGEMPDTFEVGKGSRSAPEPERVWRIPSHRQSTLGTWVDPEGGNVYVDIPAYAPPASPVQTPSSSGWSSDSLPVSPSPSPVPSPVASPVPSLVASPDIVETEDLVAELGAQVELQGGLIHDHMVRLRELPPTLFERYERDIDELNISLQRERHERLELADRIARLERRCPTKVEKPKDLVGLADQEIVGKIIVLCERGFVEPSVYDQCVMRRDGMIPLNFEFAFWFEFQDEIPLRGLDCDNRVLGERCEFHLGITFDSFTSVLIKFEVFNNFWKVSRILAKIVTQRVPARQLV